MVLAVVLAGAEAGSTSAAATSVFPEEIIEQLLPSDALRAMKPRRDNFGNAGSPVLDDVRIWKPKDWRGFFISRWDAGKFEEVTGGDFIVTPTFPTT